MENTIFTNFLKTLKVKHTQEYSNRVYNEHPYKDSLYAISHLLSMYNIPNNGIKVSSNDIELIETPFVAYVLNDFIIVKEISKEKDYAIYIWRNKELKTSIANFLRIYQGIVLIAEPNEQSREVDYREHKKRSFFYSLEKGILLAIGLLIPLVFIIRNKYWESFSILSLLVLNVIGIFICYLLLNKQVYKNNDYADKICSLFHQKDCNNVLQSKASRIGIYSWSEIGLGYFLSNFVILVFFPFLIPYMFVVNICALPYTVWSIWYQYKVARQWCMLCVIVQVLLIVISIFLVAGHIRLPIFSIINLLSIAVVYLTPILLINLLVSVINRAHKLEPTIQELNSVKKRDDVFRFLLKQQEYCEIDNSVSKIIFGNPKASVGITILTNPHCEPCGKMHKKVNNLLEVMGSKLYIQYVFSAFDDSMLDSNRFLIAAYLQSNDIRLTEQIYDDWFAKEKYSPKGIMDLYKFDLHDDSVDGEISQHNSWKLKNNLAATPTILVNGYFMPKEFKLEDLVYMEEI